MNYGWLENFIFRCLKMMDSQDVYQEFLNKFVFVNVRGNDHLVVGILKKISPNEILVKGDFKDFIINRQDITHIKTKNGRSDGYDGKGL